MQKILFFDNWGLEIADGLRRRLCPPVKHGSNPLFIADELWEEGNMQTYGSVIKLPGKPFQLWYSVMHHKPHNICLAYAESDDGLVWRKPAMDIIRYKGKKTNLIRNDDIHGPAIVFDRKTQHYRLICGSGPTKCIHVYTSADGIRWQAMNQGPVIANHPDCSMGLVQMRSGQYAAYHRHPATGRRVCRTTSWDFRYWDSQPRLVLEPDPLDPPQRQFYALGSAMYGPYELGTLWMYHTEATDLASWHFNGQQHAELAYSRGGYCWHRAAQGQPFLAHGQGKDWDRGNVQCVSQPVFLEDEIRYYYTGVDCRHSENWELNPHTAGLGVATIKPDRFIALESGAKESCLLTAAFMLSGSQLFVNAKVKRNGELRLEVLDDVGKPIKGFAGDDCLPVTGDDVAHRVVWRTGDEVSQLVGKRIRLRVHARHAQLYAISMKQPGDTSAYHEFTSPI